MVVDDQRNFGKMPRPAPTRAVEDHIFHAAAAHGRGAVFAHHPTQCFKQVRFAAPIGADNTGQPLHDHKIGGIDKAFKPVQAQPCQAHLIPFLNEGLSWPSKRTSQPNRPAVILGLKQNARGFPRASASLLGRSAGCGNGPSGHHLDQIGAVVCRAMQVADHVGGVYLQPCQCAG